MTNTGKMFVIRENARDNEVATPLLICQNPKGRPLPLMAGLGERALEYTAGEGAGGASGSFFHTYLGPYLSSDPAIPLLEICATQAPGQM